MVDHEFVLLHAALVKWALGEPLSPKDLERVIGLMGSGRLGIDAASPDVQAGLQNRLINTLDQWREGISKG